MSTLSKKEKEIKLQQIAKLCKELGIESKWTEWHNSKSGPFPHNPMQGYTEIQRDRIVTIILETEHDEEDWSDPDW